MPDDGCSLLEALRDRLHVRSAKDGCSPQGQCGCCTVLVDGQARVACVTPARRVAGREVTTVEGLDDADRWAAAFTAAGASQCGFCTPGIVVRLSGAARAGAADAGRDRPGPARPPVPLHRLADHPGGGARRRPAAQRPAAVSATWRRRPSGRPSRVTRAQQVGDHVALGRGGFADDAAPVDALVAVRSATGEWVVGETLTEARAAAGKVQGRRTTVALTWPLEVPPECRPVDGTARCAPPGSSPATSRPTRRGARRAASRHRRWPTAAPSAARWRPRWRPWPAAWPIEHGRAVRVLYAREDAVRLGPKRPPMAAGVRRDGSGVIRVVRTPGIADAIRSVAPGLSVEEVDVPGPPTSVAVRGAGWVEAAVLLAVPGRRSGHRAGVVRWQAVGGRRRRRRRVRCGCAAGRPSTRSSCARTASARPTWRWAGCARRASRSTSPVSRTTSRSVPSGSCVPSTPRRSRSTIEDGVRAAGQRIRCRVRRRGRRGVAGGRPSGALAGRLTSADGPQRPVAEKCW